jgi:hypothetical protein
MGSIRKHQDEQVRKKAGRESWYHPGDKGEFIVSTVQLWRQRSAGPLRP